LIEWKHYNIIDIETFRQNKDFIKKLSGGSTVDQIDRDIIKFLQKDARVPLTEVAKKLNMATSTVHERVRKLESQKVIVGYRPVLNAEALGLPLIAFVRVKTGQRRTKNLEAHLKQLPEIEDCHHVVGEDCFIVKVRTKNTLHLEDFLNRLTHMEEVVSTNTTIVLSTLCEDRPLLLPEDELE
jgi:Lrp/AsnC family leucine-responsive transcriptional regulator